MPRIVSILSALLLLLAACSGGGGHTALSRAEAVMEQHPDSALAILDSINPSALTSDASQAKYALLLTQAQIKNRDFPKSDSLINTAVAFFDGKGNADEMKSLFYQGNVRYFNSEYSTAIIPALRAHDLAIKLNDDYWRAKTAEQIADIYTSTSDDNTDFRREAISYYEKAGKIPNHRYAICDLAIGHINKGHISRGIELLDSIANIAKADADTSLVVYSYSALLPSYLMKDSTERANLIAHQLLNLSPYYIPSSKDCSYLAEIDINNHNYGAALEKLSFARAYAKNYSDRVVAYKTSLKPLIKEERYNEVLALTDSIIENLNVGCDFLLRQSAMTSQKDYYKSIAVSQTEKSQRLIIIIICCAVVALVIIAAIVIIFRMRLKFKNKEIELKISEIYNLTEYLNNQQSNIAFLQKQIEEDDESYSSIKEIFGTVFYERFKFLDILCAQYFEKDSESERTLHKIGKEIQKLQSDESFKEIEDMINKSNDDILNRLLQQCPFVKRKDIPFISLVYAKLSPKTICFLLDIQIKAFYSKRSRLIEKISQSSVPDKEFFLSYFQ